MTKTKVAPFYLGHGVFALNTQLDIGQFCSTKMIFTKSHILYRRSITIL